MWEPHRPRSPNAKPCTGHWPDRPQRRASSFLKNEDHTLPLKKGSALGLYGAGAVKTVKGGTGSGDVNNRRNISIYEGLREGGFVITAPSAAWLDDYDSCYDQARTAGGKRFFGKQRRNLAETSFTDIPRLLFPFPPERPSTQKQRKETGADTAVYVLSRIAGKMQTGTMCPATTT